MRSIRMCYRECQNFIFVSVLCGKTVCVSCNTALLLIQFPCHYSYSRLRADSWGLADEANVSDSFFFQFGKFLLKAFYKPFWLSCIYIFIKVTYLKFACSTLGFYDLSVIMEILLCYLQVCHVYSDFQGLCILLWVY